MTILFSEKDCFQYQNLHQLKNSGYSIETWRGKKLLGGKKWLLCGKKRLPGGKIMLLPLILQDEYKKIEQKRNSRKLCTF